MKRAETNSAWRFALAQNLTNFLPSSAFGVPGITTATPFAATLDAATAS